MKIIAISDTHGQHKQVEIPACDVLIHAGDIIPDIVRKQFTRYNPNLGFEWFHAVFMAWLHPMLNDGWVKEFVFTWGNHDWTHGYTPTLPTNCHLLVDSQIDIGGVTFWGSPWSNEFNGWSWMKHPHALRPIYGAIPPVDILISHQPPLGWGSETYFDGKIHHVGSQELMDTINRIKPKAVVCGHVHGGFGAYPHGDTTIYNVSVVNEAYRVVNDPTEIEIKNEST